MFVDFFFNWTFGLESSPAELPPSPVSGEHDAPVLVVEAALPLGQAGGEVAPELDRSTPVVEGSLTGLHSLPPVSCRGWSGLTGGHWRSPSYSLASGSS